MAARSSWAGSRSQCRHFPKAARCCRSSAPRIPETMERLPPLPKYWFSISWGFGLPVELESGQPSRHPCPRSCKCLRHKPASLSSPSRPYRPSERDFDCLVTIHGTLCAVKPVSPRPFVEMACMSGRTNGGPEPRLYPPSVADCVRSRSHACVGPPS